jgi:hypothetical protein
MAQLPKHALKAMTDKRPPALPDSRPPDQSTRRTGSDVQHRRERLSEFFTAVGPYVYRGLARWR